MANIHLEKKYPVVNLMGPTASGKTALACALYDTGQFEIISVDSALIYKDMNIGTAKPTEDELKRYPHHLINIRTPLESYSVAEFVQDAKQLIHDIHQQGKIPLLVGGTMLYFKSLLEGLADHLPQANAQIRKEIIHLAEQQGWEHVYAKLCQVDPLAGQKFKVTDKQRIIRALEVFYLTGLPISQHQIQQEKNKPYEYNFMNYALLPDRAQLHQQIEQRLAQMWELGFLAEVQQLMTQYPLNLDSPAMRCVGYRQVLDYLYQEQHQNQNAPMNLTDTKLKALYATRQLAKRQYTWLRSLQELHHFYTFSHIEQGIEDLLKRFN